VLFLVLAAFLVGLAAIVLGGLAAFRPGRELFRTMGSFNTALDAELKTLNEQLDRVEQKAAVAGDTARLEAAVARLRRSRARLNVLTAAWSDARGALTRFTSVVPRR